VNQRIRFVKGAKNKENPWPVRIACSLAALYLIAPVDVVPDFIPVFGLLDDLLVILGVVTWVINRRKKLNAQP
jgi:uncharacterized membrane protein YkvA (DUF1232 family)